MNPIFEQLQKAIEQIPDRMFDAMTGELSFRELNTREFDLALSGRAVLNKINSADTLTNPEISQKDQAMVSGNLMFLQQLAEKFEGSGRMTPKFGEELLNFNQSGELPKRFQKRVDDGDPLSDPLSMLKSSDPSRLAGSVHSQLLDTMEDTQGGTAVSLLTRIADGIDTLVEIMRGGARGMSVESNAPTQERQNIGWNLMVGPAAAPPIGSTISHIGQDMSMGQSPAAASEDFQSESGRPARRRSAVRDSDWRRDPPPIRSPRRLDDDE